MASLANRITFHHTAGVYIPNARDKHCYHYLIDNKGKVYKGDFSIADNFNCADGKYAAHCGGGNTKNIGIAFCGNFHFLEKTKTTSYPLTRIQLEVGFKLAAELCAKYNIKISPETVFTHYEFDQRKKKPEGKIDIIYLPPFPFVKINDIGNFIRNKVSWYIHHL